MRYSAFLRYSESDIMSNYDPIEVCWDCRKEIVDFIKDKMKHRMNGKKKEEEE